jgi:nicotinamide-nucleotide amidase
VPQPYLFSRIMERADMYALDLTNAAEDLLAAARAKSLKIATAESCTGGLIAGLLTEIAGSSDVFDRGFVTYSNAAKQAHLDVPIDILTANGAVSEPVARAMVAGALTASAAQIAIAVTGVAGPGGGTADKPVGLVHMAAARIQGGTESVQHIAQRYGDIGRSAVRMATVRDAIVMLRAQIDAFSAE